MEYRKAYFWVYLFLGLSRGDWPVELGVEDPPQCELAPSKGTEKNKRV